MAEAAEERASEKRRRKEHERHKIDEHEERAGGKAEIHPGFPPERAVFWCFSGDLWSRFSSRFGSSLASFLFFFFKTVALRCISYARFYELVETSEK